MQLEQPQVSPLRGKRAYARERAMPVSWEQNPPAHSCRDPTPTCTGPALAIGSQSSVVSERMTSVKSMCGASDASIATSRAGLSAPPFA